MCTRRAWAGLQPGSRALGARPSGSVAECGGGADRSGRGAPLRPRCRQRPRACSARPSGAGRSDRGRGACSQGTDAGTLAVGG